MSFLIPEGNYKASIINYGLMKTKAGKPMVAVDFEFSVEGKPESLRWFGSLNEGMAREITLSTLADLGYSDTDLGNFSDGKGLDDSRFYFITVNNDEYQGKKRSKISWVNLQNSTGKTGFVSSADAQGLLAGIDLRAELTMAAQGTARDDVPKELVSTHIDDVPF